MKGFVASGSKTDAAASIHVSSLFSPTNQVAGLWLLRKFADEKLKQRNKMSKDLLNRRPVCLPRIPSVLRISHLA
jgi:hypothetical protein